MAGRAKLTEADRVAIRARRAATGLSYRAIGEEFGVSAATISDVLNGRPGRAGRPKAKPRARRKEMAPRNTHTQQRRAMSADARRDMRLHAQGMVPEALETLRKAMGAKDAEGNPLWPSRIVASHKILLWGVGNYELDPSERMAQRKDRVSIEEPKTPQEKLDMLDEQEMMLRAARRQIKRELQDEGNDG